MRNRRTSKEPPTVPAPPNPPVPTIEQWADNVVYLSLPKDRIPQMVKEYIQALELGNTEEWCKCEWSIHPADVGVAAFCCRNCKDHMAKHQDRNTRDESGNFLEIPCTECGCDLLQTRRLRLKEQHDECPIHTREGLILGFYEWVFSQQGECNTCAGKGCPECQAK